MYTENEYEDNEYVDYNEDEVEEYEESFWDKNKSLIFKILIIVLCVIILIWLVSKLGNKKEEVKSNYDNNVTQVRLASEQYFFINNKPVTTGTISLNELINRNLISGVADATGKSCDTNNSTVKLDNNTVNYIMTIKLDCGKDNEARNYYYRLDNYACENCNGTTYMTGENTDVKPVTPTEDNTVIIDDNSDLYTCEWSNWSTTRNYDSNLVERTRTVVRAQKQNNIEETVYGDWSEYTTTPITATDSVEVETKLDTVDTWVSETSSDKVIESDTIRNVEKHTSGGSSYKYCPSDYEKVDGKCRKDNTRTISATDYVRLSGTERKDCSPKRETANKVVYVCGGYTYTDMKTGYSGGSTSYTYERLVQIANVLYRSRTKTTSITVTEPEYTEYLLESEIPAGYTKVAGSETTEYSYRVSECGK